MPCPPKFTSMLNQKRFSLNSKQHAVIINIIPMPWMGNAPIHTACDQTGSAGRVYPNRESMAMLSIKHFLMPFIPPPPPPCIFSHTNIPSVASRRRELYMLVHVYRFDVQYHISPSLYYPDHRPTHQPTTWNGTLNNRPPAPAIRPPISEME